MVGDRNIANGTTTSTTTATTSRVSPCSEVVSFNNNTNNTGNKMISRKNKTPNPEGIGKENSRNKNKTTTSPKQSGVSANVH